VLAVIHIPYHTFPILVHVGGFKLRTFGLMVGCGVLIGAWVAGSYAEQFGVDRDKTYQLATRLVVAGVVGARVSWDVSHTNQIHSALDLIAVWKGGLQFSGGFLAAVIVATPTFRTWSKLLRWRVVDGLILGLTIGLAIGRIGCTSVGEHFGSQWGASWDPLMVRYLGGTTRETTLGPNGPAVTHGMVFHNCAIYELLWLLILFPIMWRILHRVPRVAPGTGVAIFAVVYGPLRFGFDFLRINDKLVYGLTGAQYFMIGLMIGSIWLWLRVVPNNRALQEAELAAESQRAPEAEPDTEPADPSPEPQDH
jgi:phosphatidylglycerol:prolipoprotein diacylglycerol transferase